MLSISFIDFNLPNFSESQLPPQIQYNEENEDQKDDIQDGQEEAKERKGFQKLTKTFTIRSEQIKMSKSPREYKQTPDNNELKYLLLFFKNQIFLFYLQTLQNFI